LSSEAIVRSGRQAKPRTVLGPDEASLVVHPEEGAPLDRAVLMVKVAKRCARRDSAADQYESRRREHDPQPPPARAPSTEHDPRLRANRRRRHTVEDPGGPIIDDAFLGHADRMACVRRDHHRR
jgi:hypothetical protein